MSMRISAFKPHENMRIGSFSVKNMLINFDSDVVEETTTAVQLVKVNYQEDTSASFETFPPDELQTINNLETSTAMTIHNYQNPDETPRFGFYKYAVCQQNPVRLWSYENNTKVFTETYPSNTLSLLTTLQKYQKIDSYNFATGQTLFSNKPLSCGFQGTMGRALNLSHGRGKVFQDNCRSITIDVYIVSHHDNNTVKYQTSTGQAQQTTTLSKNQEFKFTSALTSNTTDFWTVHSTEDISVFATGISQDHDTVYPAQNINDQGILTGLQNTPCITVWDTANPTGTNPTYQLIVNYSDNTIDDVYTNAGTTIALANKAYQDGFARVYLTGSTPSTVHIYCGSEGDGLGNNSTNAVPVKFLSSRIQFDNSIDNPSHIQHVAFGIQFQSGVDTIKEYETNLSFNGEATPTFIKDENPLTSSIQPDGTKLLHWRLFTDIDKHLYSTEHTTTLFYIITQIDGGEEAVTGTCDGVRSKINTTEYTIDNKKALSLNYSGLSQNIGLPSSIYDTSIFGVTTLAVFSRNNTELNNPWFKITGHNNYFSIIKYSTTNNITLMFRGTAYSSDILIPFPFSSLTNTDNHLVYGSVRQISSQEYQLHCELWSFTTKGSSTLVDTQTSTITLPFDDTHASFSETDYLVAMDTITGNPIPQYEYGSLTIAETRHYKGNFKTSDKDQLIQDIISYWEIRIPQWILVVRDYKNSTEFITSPTLYTETGGDFGDETDLTNAYSKLNSLYTNTNEFVGLTEYEFMWIPYITQGITEQNRKNPDTTDTFIHWKQDLNPCLLYTSPSPRDS